VLFLSLIALALVFAGVPYALSMLIQHLRPLWPRRRKVMAGALPLPFGVVAMSAAILIRGALGASQSCGVDCGIAEIFGMGGLVLGAMGAVLGLAVSAVALRKE
jgi:hypothetical protein